MNRIFMAESKGFTTWVYGDRRQILFSVSGECVGYTGNSVTTRSPEGSLHTWNGQGQLVG